MIWGVSTSKAYKSASVSHRPPRKFLVSSNLANCPFKVLLAGDRIRPFTGPLSVLVAYRLLAPGSEWRLHREWHYLVGTPKGRLTRLEKHLVARP
jgi:hypothetical protein